MKLSSGDSENGGAGVEAGGGAGRFSNAYSVEGVARTGRASGVLDCGNE